MPRLRALGMLANGFQVAPCLDLLTLVSETETKQTIANHVVGQPNAV
jgi:hypothetical protein